MSEPGSAYRLSVLEERWRSDRSPRVFLQLSDELRRAGRSGRAVEVLRDGLRWHPESVSGWVAFGRLLLDDGEPEAAVEALDHALDRDPSQVVACRLLTECWIRLGDAERATASLERARLLALPDADLEQLSGEIATLRQTSPAPERTGEPVAIGVAAARPFELGPPASLPAIDLDRAGAGRRGWRRARLSGEPFGELLALPPAARGIEKTLREPGIFGSRQGPETASLAFEATPPPSPVAAPALLEPEFRPYSIGEEVERETALDAESQGGAELPATDERFDVAPLPAATSTLAALYLAQGHFDEAEGVYRRVLADHGGDVEALAGLERVAQSRRAQRSPARTEPGTPRLAGLTARRLQRLRRLYDRLRAERRQRGARVS